MFAWWKQRVSEQYFTTWGFEFVCGCKSFVSAVPQVSGHGGTHSKGCPGSSISTSPRHFVDHEIVCRGNFWGGSLAAILQANAFTASGSSFAAPSTSAGASAAQGRPEFVVPMFVLTFLPLTPSHSLSIATMVPLLSQDRISSTLPLPQVSLSSAILFPVLKQPFIVGPGFIPVPAMTVGQVVAGKFADDLGDLLPSSVSSADPEPQLLFDSRLILTSMSKKPKRCVEDITTWMEAFSIYCLILTSFFPCHSKDLLQYKLLILRTYCQFNGKF